LGNIEGISANTEESGKRSFSLGAVFSRGLDVAILTIPVETAIFRFFPAEIVGRMGHGHIAAIIGKVINSTHIYTANLWTLLGLMLIYRTAFRKKQKRGLGIAIPTAIVFVALLSVFEGPAGQFGSDSLDEVTRTQWTQVADYTLQFLQTSIPSKEQVLLSFFPIVLLLFVYLLVRARIYRPNAWMASVSGILMAGILVLCLYIDISSYFESRSGYAIYERNLREGTQRGVSHFQRKASAPEVFVYIGESSNRDALYTELKDQLKDSSLSSNAVLYSDVVSPHSHTFLSLIRTLTVAGDPELDQLTDDKKLSRINVVSILKKNGIITSWISNKPSYEWVAALIGQQADEIYIQNKDNPDQTAVLRKKDGELLPMALGKLKTDKPEAKVVFFHTQAGHGEYCDNIPRTAVSRIPDPEASLPFSALYGEIPLLSEQRQRQNVRCYRNAMSYVADNLVTSMKQLSQATVPEVLIYISDHGEDVADGTGHDSSRPSFRKIEVPFLVYFNDAAKRAYPDKFEAATANKDMRYATTWLSDSILDLEGVSDDRREQLSIFRPLNRIPDRFSSLRWYGGKEHVIAVDDAKEIGNGIQTTDIDLYAKEQLIRALPADEQGKICASQTDSLQKFSDAARGFSCLQADLVVDVQRQEVFVYRPPQKKGGLTLDNMVNLSTKQPSELWLSLIDARGSTLQFLLSYLNKRFPAERRGEVLVDLSLEPAENNSAREILSRFRREGYGLSYSLATKMAVKCSEQQERPGCEALRKSVEETLRSAPYSSLSFDIRAKRFATSISRPAGVEMNIWDLHVKAEKDLDREMLQRAGKYQIPYESAFDY